MNENLVKLASKIGTDTIATTRALTHAIALSCRSLQTLVEESDEIGMPEIGSGEEAGDISAAIAAMVAARRAQVKSRVALLRGAQRLGIVAYGEGCLCGGASLKNAERALKEA